MCTCSFISLQAVKAHAAKVHGRSGVTSLKVKQPVLASVKASKSRGITVHPTHGFSEDLSYDDEKRKKARNNGPTKNGLLGEQVILWSPN